MQIQINGKKGAATTIVFSEGTLSKFVEKNGVSELRVGYGTEKPLPRRKVILLLRKVVSVAKQNRVQSVAIDWQEIRSTAEADINSEHLGEIASIAFHMANFEFNTYKTPPKEGFILVEEISIFNCPAEAQAGIERGEIIAQEINTCRELSNTPGGDMTPQTLAQAAQKAVSGTKASVTVLGREEMSTLGMGAVLGIAKGSTEEPRFIVMEYFGTDTSKKPIVLIGKGVTFDTGGLNVKPGDSMYEMHMDMSGGAAVISTLALAAKLELPVNVIGLVPAVENSPSGSSVRPGDVLKSLSGKTIEVLNTDAEGRVILADAITYAKKYNPEAIVDVATLTGAALTALGVHASAFMTNEQGLPIAELMQIAESSGDYMWPFPVWEEYEEMVKGNFADVPNISTAGNSRYGGVIAGGMFLREFAKELDCFWMHIDMAPRMTASSSEFLAKGAAGAPVRFLLKFIEHHAQ